MWKSLLLLAVMANTFFIKPSEGSAYSMAAASSSSSTSSKGSSASSSSHSSSSSYSYNPNNCSTSKPTRPPCKCPKNEVFDLCPAPCPPRECGVNLALILCAVPPKVGDPECKPGCRCRDDYLRNYDGVCVPKDECPRCPRNEVYDECPAPCPPRRCDVDERLIRCAAGPKPGDPDCEPGCRCADGYLRNNDEVCVPRDQCPPQCGKHEIYSKCPSFEHRPLYCSEVGFPVEYPPTDGPCPVEPACVCDYGYVKNDSGVCIPIEECPSCGGDPNAISGCGVNCGRYCSNYKKKNVSCIQVCYENACDCRKGFVVDDNTKKCVYPKDCTPICGVNEVYSNCTNGGCGPKECSGLGFNIGCVKMDQKYCKEGCICKEGYLRDDNGKCIPKGECPACGGDPNAVAGCGINCGRLCSNYDKGPVGCAAVCYDDGCDCRKGFVLDENTGLCVRPKDCTPVCKKNEVFSTCVNGGCSAKKCSQLGKPIPCVKPKKCIIGCLCKEGWLRADNGKCIPKEQCPQPQCGKNERLEQCPDTLCTPQNCSQLGFPWPAIPCPPPGDGPCPGPPVCVCIDDYVRDGQGNCIPKKYCPSCGGDPNAVSGCGVNCGRLCSNYNQGPVACLDICYPNACDCRDGFVLDENIGMCVRPEKCTPICGINEVYDTCGNMGCRRWNCSQPEMCIDTIECEGRCVCLNDYARADNGTCIPVDQCENCYKPHEYWDACAPTCPPQTCESIDRHYKCPAQPLYCRGACRCEKGYYRNKNGDCITKKECRKCTGPHEYFACGGACDNVCATINKQNQTHCLIRNIQCNSMCYCETGYARNDENICIPIDKCPAPQCADDERYEECPDNLCIPLACSELGYPINCPALSGNSSTECPGEPGCICDYGNVRDDNGNCIPKDQCPSCGGDPNAVSGCGINCGRRCSNYKKKNVVCPFICKLNGCDCREGFVYDDNLKKCVRPKHCTPTCGINEVYDRCANGGCRKWTCSQPEICKRPIKCKGGCVCQDGYTRAENGTCIPINECPEEQCGENERYEKCPDTLCTPQNCSQLGFPWPAIPCPSPGDGPCPGPPACVCIDDHVRNDQGNCIPKKDCPSCGGDPNAVSGCGVNCGRLCSNYDQGPVPCPKICYPNACDCRDGFVLDENIGKCVRPEECKKCYKPHEYWDACAPRCPPQTCESIDRHYRCPPQPLYCRGACRCEKGYYRNKNGDCITKKECKKCTGPHEYFACGGACDNVCATINKQNQTHCLIRNIQCNRMCYCETGYARNAKNICIPIDECPAPLCPDDERYEECPDSICEPLACSELGLPLDCLILSDSPNATCPGKPGCVCDYGNVRDDNGKCIPRDQCPSCGGDPNAVSGCGGNCGRRCLDYKEPNVVCPLICMLNGCDCREGFVYDDNLKKCVHPEDCTSTCGINEVYSNCANGGCRKWKCSEPIICYEPGKCEGGCVCQDGYTRAKNGTCIPENQCPGQCNKPHEYYNECAPTCPPQTCESIGKIYHCPIQPAVCKGACVCEDGYYRNKIGECISKKDCKKCTGPHEYFSCGVACDNVCATLNKQNQTSCPIINIVCNRMCYCEKDYARDKNNICIPIDKCPAQLCPDDQRYEECPDFLCEPLACSELGFPINCPDLTSNPNATCPGEPGCVCDYGNVRDDCGNCIPKNQCPSCGGDPNAISGCGGNCGRRCSDYKKPNVACPLICMLNGCDCREGFVYDDNLHKCVRPENCTPTCGINEVYSDCANGGCRKWKCSEPTICIYPFICEEGCVCQKGYTRAENGTCIPENQCPVPECGPNERYEQCPDALCTPQTCAQLGFPISCPAIADDTGCPGLPGCVCDYGYVRDDDGICIPDKDCPSCGGDPNAVTGCGINCGRLCSNYDKGPVPCPKICKFNACDCRKGYVLDENINKCVRPKQCTPICGKDEVYSECINGGCQRKNCYQLGKPVPCFKIDPKDCIEGCLCKEKYLRAKNGTCIPEDQCPEPKCGKGQRYVKCPEALCAPLTCSEVGFPVPCPDLPQDGTCPGSPDCVCNDSYVKDANGNCIPWNECPSCGGDPNAISGCGDHTGNRCSDYKNNKGANPLICYYNACDCKKGYVFDDIQNKCVRPKHCSPTCGKNEVYDTCANGGCDKRNCSQLGEPTLCIDPIKCQGGCVCKPGYLRAKNGTCILEAQCPDPCKKPREVYDPCPPICPPQTCESIGQAYPCPLKPPGSPDYCNGACRCEDGYYRNKIGECISKKDCLKCMGPNEYFFCGSACDNVCATLQTQNQTNCPIINKKCNPKCYCEEGYARDGNNICIPIEQCGEEQCGDNERYEKCPDTLCTPQNCSQLGFPFPAVPCPPPGDGPCPGPSACVCIDDYVRDDQGNCIPKKDCPSCGGDPNAVSGCGVNCGKLCSNYDKGPARCPKICYPNACDCREGFVLKENIGKCVRPEECKKCTGPHEYFACGGACDNVCATINKQNQTHCPIQNIQCNSMCYCETGYARNDENICIPIDECPAPQCADDERYEECPDNLCITLACSELGYPIQCPTLSGNSSSGCPGEPGCICDYGNVRDDNGNCIPKDQCPSCGGDPNAVSGCGVNCGRLCSNYDQGPVPCPAICYPNACDCKDGFVLDENIRKCVRPENCTPICGINEVYDTCGNSGCRRWNCSQPEMCIDTIECEGRCVCINDYARADNGTCIPVDQCEKCFKPHEYWDACAPTCPPQTCESIDRHYECPAQPLYCRGACRCEKGYYRNKNGDCITKKECKKCTGPHEYFACGGACDNVCATINKQNQTHCLIRNIQCNRMCYCETGYARNDENICIPIDECPAPLCPNDERYEECPDSICEPLACSELGLPLDCLILSDSPNATCPGKPGCVCDYGNVRDDNGKCIPRDQCPSCGGDPNAVSGCGSNCGRRCLDYKEPNVVCPLICILNGCDCKEGFVYDDNLKKCVHPDDCTSTCGINEVYSNCANGGCRKWKCSEPIICYEPGKCEGGCVCQDGYTRAKNGTCIPENQCPGQCNKPHEYYNECAPTCPPQTCESIGKIYNCPIQPAVCKGACVCEDGYYRNKIGECISKEDCTKCSGPHEYFSCGVACDNVCATLNKQNQTSCPIINIDCNRMCYCEKDYARDENNICIPIDKCPAPLCPDDQRYEECPDFLCEPLACSELGFPIDCPDLTNNPNATCPGEPRCVCDYGNVRDDSGNCIPKNQCPSCGGDPNAVSGCGVNCGRLCSNYDQGPVLCPAVCYPNACDCRDGFVLDEIIGKCVRPENCSQCNKPHEYYNECAPTCPPQTCESIGKIYYCPIQPAVCKGACVCEDGYYRNKIGECISKEDCTKCTGPHEYFSCGVACDNVCATLNKQNQTSCPIINIDCNRMCYCEKDYARDENNICIPVDKCPAPLCPDDQRYEECPDFLCEPLACSELGFPIDCPDLTNNPNATCPGEPRCVCDYGNVRDDSGNCIPKNQCPSCGGDRNAVSGCGVNCGRLCSNYDQGPVLCPAVCYPNACDCRDGFVLDEIIGKCVRPENCSQCNKPHEYYNECAPTCPPQTCESIGKIYYCPIQPAVCKGACVCEDGYYRNKIGECISKEDCTKCTGPHEYFSCGVACDNVCATLNKQNQTSCPIINIDCNRMCYCEKDYARDENNICIPIDKCPAPLCPDDQRYEECPDFLCEPLACSELGFPIDCPDITNSPNATCPGEPGCVCDYGNVRNDCGNCIPKNQCPSCGGDPNAISGCGGNCGRRCSDYKKPNVACPLICMFNGCDCREGFVYDDNLHKCVRPENCNLLICEGGCVCQKGYTWAENGTCISENRCPVPECGPNERYEQCPDALCTPQTCSQLGFPISCPAIADDTGCPGLPGCVCDYGYVRDDDGICIPDKDCPSCGGDPNAVTGCGINCGRLCSNYDKGPVPCPKICKFNACDCRKGYVLDENINKCVRPKQCTPICGKDEVYSECINGGCQRKNCSQLGKPVPCVKIDPKYCIEGCLCKEKYLRAKNGTCIPEDQCPKPKCGKGQRYVKCPEALCAPLTCSEVGFPVPCPNLPQDGRCPGSPDCVCNDSYVKDANGNCIPWNECPSCGGDPNAISGCGDHTGNRCSDYKNNKGADPLICYYNACDCKKGYVFDDIQNKCVRPKHCSPTCGKNEVYDTCANGGCDKRNCSQLGEPTLCIDPIKCQGGCVCKPGYLRAKNGTCILEAQCPDQCKKPREVYDPCPPICPPQTCESIGKAYPCPLKPPGSPDYCNGACRCEDGYYRNKIGECISKKDCLKCMGPNEYFSCGSACDNVCATLQKQNQTNCPIINKKCNPKCYCEEGYARDGNNICIPIEQCGEEQCGDNERYEKCPDTLCTPQNCSQLGFPWPAIPCPPPGDGPCPGPPACVCIDDYVRDNQGNCIPKKDCPSCGGDPNSVSGCGVNCGRLCSNYDQGPVPCLAICYPNACDCRDGFVLDENIGKCVRPENCTPLCPDDERYEECPDSVSEPLACSELGLPLDCLILSDSPNATCPGKPGCICDYGNVRDDNGKCIPRDQCPSCGGDPNAVSGCGGNCGRRCLDYKEPNVACPLICMLNGCDCREGFVYDDNLDKCVRPENCTPTCGINEVYSNCANSGCRKWKCSEPTICIDPLICEGGCVCQIGYTRAENGTCIPENQCPVPECGPNERYEQCPDALCTPQTCAQLGFPISCPAIADDTGCPGLPGCVCDYGYVRDDDGICIPDKDCPSCGGDPNAVTGCGINCGRLCSNYDKGPVPCPKICKFNACDCKKGYVLDENIKKCVRPKQCTPICGKYEVYSECINGGCQRKNCAQLGKPVPCVKIDPNDCIEGCLCKEKYLRAKNGTCIPEDQCPAPPDSDGSSSSTAMNNTDIKARLDKGAFFLSGEFIYQLSQSKPDENFVCSGTSVLLPLAQITPFARGVVLEQLLAVQNLKNIDEVKSIYPSIIESYQNQQEVEFEVANKYFFNKNYKLSDNFQEVSQKYFNATGQNVDFSRNEEAAKIINDYVSNRTRDKIQNLISPDALDAYTIVVLINALYYKGDWLHQFNPNDTQKRDFTKRDKSVVQLDTMYQQNTFNYAENNDMRIQALEMQYENRNFSFLVILPEEGYFDQTVQACRDPEIVMGIINSLSLQTVQVYMPKLLITTNMDMGKMLTEANVSKMFDPNSDGFQGILADDKPLYISSAVQKAYLECDETGSKAAAATGITVGTTSAMFPPPEIFTFNANRSYIFFLLFKYVPIFCGAVVGAQ